MENGQTSRSLTPTVSLKSLILAAHPAVRLPVCLSSALRMLRVQFFDICYHHNPDNIDSDLQPRSRPPIFKHRHSCDACIAFLLYSTYHPERLIKHTHTHIDVKSNYLSSMVFYAFSFSFYLLSLFLKFWLPVWKWIGLCV